MLPALSWIFASGFLGPCAWPNSQPSSVYRHPATSSCHRASTIALIDVTEELAQEQRDEYFALMPSRKLPTVSLDLRAWAPKDADNFEAGVFARQEETVPTWKNVGVIACEDPNLFTQACAKQRDLLVRWAYELCNDFETNTLLMNLEKTIEIAWVVKPEKPSFFDSLLGKAPPEEEEAQPTLVPTDTAFEEGLRCGFLGVLAREYRGGGVSARNERIVIGKEPEIPYRRPSQEKYNAKYAKKGKIIV